MTITNLQVSYSTFQQLVPKVPTYFIQQGNGSYILAGTGDSIFIECHLLDPSEVEHYETNFKSSGSAVPSLDDAKVLGIIANNSPIVAPYQQDKASLVAVVGREGSETIQATHDFTKKETWFTNSIRVDWETLYNSGDDLTFSGSHNFWIDMTHGKVYDEDAICQDISHGYSINVVSNQTSMSVREPFLNSGGDYTINYRSGSITFGTPQTTGSVETAYSYATNSTWVLKPTPGKFIDVEEAEIQFSDNIGYNDAVLMEAYGYVQVFAPDYWDANGGPLPTNSLVQLEQTKYKTFYQIIDEALGSYPKLPYISSSCGRGSRETYGFPFRYGAVKRVQSTYGMEVRVSLENDIEMGGDRATATFYCLSRQETQI